MLRFFEFGTPPFQRLVGEFRRRMFEEVAASALPGLIFTYVWAFDQPTDAAAVESYASPFRARGGRVLFIELEATQDERLRRNETPFRLAEKPFKRDLAASRARVLEDDATYQLNSQGAFDARDDYLRLHTRGFGAAARRRSGQRRSTGRGSGKADTLSRPFPATTTTCMPTLQEQFGGLDIYLFDQLVRGNVSKGMTIFDAG